MQTNNTMGLGSLLTGPGNVMPIPGKKEHRDEFGSIIILKIFEDTIFLDFGQIHPWFRFSDRSDSHEFGFACVMVSHIFDDRPFPASEWASGSVN
jgi:hypothetical protein